MQLSNEKWSTWSRAGYRPHHYGPLLVLWMLGLAPSKRQADLLLVFIILASSLGSYFMITGYTIKYESVFHPTWTELR